MSKPILRLSRANFSNDCMLYWFTYFQWVLEDKYEVVIDSENPDIVFYSNVWFTTEQPDLLTGKLARDQASYGPEVKRIFVSGEQVVSHSGILNQGDNYFAIGPQPEEHPRYLRAQITNNVSVWGLYHESKFVDTPLDWLLRPRNGEEILASKKHFCGVVQSSVVPSRVEMFEKLSAYKFVRACGNWITNVPYEEIANRAGIDGDAYLTKVQFLQNCKFSMQMQSGNLAYYTQEKLLHGLVANTIPIFWGNDKVLEDGWNPEAFINSHDYDSFDAVVERVKEIDQDDSLYKRIVSQPMFLDNKLPYYMEKEYIFEFLEKVIAQ